MFSLFRENIRIAYDSIRSQLLRTILTVVIIAIGITALVAILSLVKALENTISSDFSSMGANTFNIQRYEFTTRRRGSGEKQKINPVIRYTEVKDFEERYTYPFTQVSVSFTGTSSAEVKYENVIANPEKEIRDLLKNCKLSWDKNCLKFYNNKRPVKTASDVQSRKKIYKTSIDSWKKYKKYLKEFIKKLPN